MEFLGFTALSASGRGRERLGSKPKHSHHKKLLPISPYYIGHTGSLVLRLSRSYFSAQVVQGAGKAQFNGSLGYITKLFGRVRCLATRQTDALTFGSFIHETNNELSSELTIRTLLATRYIKPILSYPRWPARYNDTGRRSPQSYVRALSRTICVKGKPISFLVKLYAAVTLNRTECNRSFGTQVFQLRNQVGILFGSFLTKAITKVFGICHNLYFGIDRSLEKSMYCSREFHAIVGRIFTAASNLLITSFCICDDCRPSSLSGVWPASTIRPYLISHWRNKLHTNSSGVNCFLGQYV